MPGVNWQFVLPRGAASVIILGPISPRTFSLCLISGREHNLILLNCSTAGPSIPSFACISLIPASESIYHFISLVTQATCCQCQPPRSSNTHKAPVHLVVFRRSTEKERKIDTIPASHSSKLGTTVGNRLEPSHCLISTLQLYLPGRAGTSRLAVGITNRA